MKVFYTIIFLLFNNLLYSQCTINNSTDCECENANDTDCDLLPDITVSWETGINGSQEYPPGEGLQSGEINYPENWFEIDEDVIAMGRIRVSAKTPNIGAGPLNLRGTNVDGYRWMVCFDSGIADTFQIYDPEWQENTYCPDGSSPKHIPWQRIYHKNADGTMSFYEKMVGTMEYHPTHGHMHFNNWTKHTLRVPDPTNMDNPLEWEVIGEGTSSIHFCVMDLGSCENGGCMDVETVYGEGTELFQDDFPNYGLGGGSYGCSPISQGISSGYSSSMGGYLDGMFLNIPLGTCNGDYAVVIELTDKLVESNNENNYTWFPITLTQQSQGTPPTTIASTAEGLLCEGQMVELSVETTVGSSVEWSNGMTGASIEVADPGNYSVTVVDDSYDCPFTETISIFGINNPEVYTVPSCINEVTNLYASSENDITWYDADNNMVGQGESFQTPVLQAGAMFYVSSSISSYNTAPLAHQGDNEYSSGANSNGYVMFDALNDFTLTSVEVYTNEPGERKIMLWDEDGNVVASHTEDVGFSEDDAHIITLNFNITAGQGYILGTDTATNETNFGGGNPQLKRTDATGLNYPYVLDGLLSIENSPYGTDWYYYFYNWSVAIEPIECPKITVPLIVEECSSNDVNILSFLKLQNDLCESNGMIQLVNQSLTLPYELSITYPNLSETTQNVFTDTLTLDNLSGGNYTFEAVSNGDTATGSVEILSEIITTNFFVNTFSNNGYGVECHGDCDGQIFSSVSPTFNGLPTGDIYTTFWYEDSVVVGQEFFTSNVSSNSNQSNLCAGQYAFLFVSPSGCEHVRYYELTEPDIIQNTIITNPATSINDCNGIAIIETTWGVEPYQYFWNEVQSQSISYLCPGVNILTTYDSFGCESQDTIFVGPEIYGCMDEIACNYDSFANLNNYDCEYPDMYYDCDGNCISDFDNDGVCNELEIFGCTDFNAPNYDPSATENDGTCIECNIEVNYILSNATTEFSCNGIIGFNFVNLDNEYSIYINDQLLTNIYTNTICYGQNYIFITDTDGCEFSDSIFINFNSVNGCTDPDAGNYNPEATIDDGSCISPQLACEITPVGLFVDNIIHERVIFNWDSPTVAPSYYMIRYRAVGTSSWTVMSAGPNNSNEFTGTSRTRYFMQSETTYQWNIRARDIDEDGNILCQSSWSETNEFTTLPDCPNLINLEVNTEANWVDFMADASDSEIVIYDSKGKLRIIGENNFRYITGTFEGIDFRKGNFIPSTNYEWHTKSWCEGNLDDDGNPDPQYHSGWGDFSEFMTEDLCDKLPLNLNTTTNGSQNLITMNWDTPLSGEPDHYFLELNNETTGQLFQWNNISASATSKTKYNQVPGHSFSWRIRGACGSSGTSWATVFSQPENYTLGAGRLSYVDELNVYPNPSNDVFNISFSVKEAQDITLEIVNVLGEVIFDEVFENFEGSFLKSFDMTEESNGIYLLKIHNLNGMITTKLTLQ